jgi:replicative DNA helicase
MENNDKIKQAADQITKGAITILTEMKKKINAEKDKFSKEDIEAFKNTVQNTVGGINGLKKEFENFQKNYNPR